MQTKRKLHLLLASIITLLFITSTASGYNLFSAGKTKQERIILDKGKTGSSGPSRAPAAPSLEVYQTDDVLTVYFLNELGYVDIKITDDTGAVVYQTSEPSGYDVTAVIDLYGLDSGVYTITFTNAGSLYLNGEFEL